MEGRGEKLKDERKIVNLLINISFKRRIQEGEGTKFKEDEENKKALKIYEETFKNEKSQIQPKFFVKGGIIDPTLKKVDEKEKGDLYLPSQEKKSSVLSSSTSSSSSNLFKSSAPSIFKKEKDNKPKIIDSFFNEIKSKRQQQEKNKPYPEEKEPKIEPEKIKQETVPVPEEEKLTNYEQAYAAFDFINQAQTHCFVENDSNCIFITDLTPEINERTLRNFFDSYGDIQSVSLSSISGNGLDKVSKIVGFLEFKDKEQAMRARNEAMHKKLMGIDLKPRFGKSFKPSDSSSSSASKFDVKSNADAPKIVVKIPENTFLRKIIDKLAKLVSQEGYLMEQAVVESEKANSEFAFLFIKNSEDHLYYRWRVFSFAQGDTEKFWNGDPFQMFVNGPVWHPPQVPDIVQEKSSSREKERERMKKFSMVSTRMRDSGREEFENMLRDLSTDRNSIADAMVWSLEHAELSAEIVLIITQSMNIIETELSKKLARLYLISDILHNTGSSIQTKSYFWSYRMYFEYKLPEIFESINKALLRNSTIDKWESNEFKDNVMRVLRIWNDWGLYDSKYIFGLEALLHRKEKHFQALNTDKYKVESQKFFVQDTSTQIGIKLRVMEEGLLKESHSMLEKACRANGLPITGTRANIIERLLILEEYRLLQDSENQGESMVKNLENQKNIALALIEKFNKPSKFLSRETVSELEQSVQDSLELLKILQKRYERFVESDIDGLPLDDIDIKLYDITKDEDNNPNNISGVGNNFVSAANNNIINANNNVFTKKEVTEERSQKDTAGQKDEKRTRFLVEVEEGDYLNEDELAKIEKKLPGINQERRDPLLQIDEFSLKQLSADSEERRILFSSLVLSKDRSIETLRKIKEELFEKDKRFSEIAKIEEKLKSYKSSLISSKAYTKDQVESIMKNKREDIFVNGVKPEDALRLFLQDDSDKRKSRSSNSSEREKRKRKKSRSRSKSRKKSRSKSRGKKDRSRDRRSSSNDKSARPRKTGDRRSRSRSRSPRKKSYTSGKKK